MPIIDLLLWPAISAAAARAHAALSSFSWHRGR
jgi:hypothetical protein